MTRTSDTDPRPGPMGYQRQNKMLPVYSVLYGRSWPTPFHALHCASSTPLGYASSPEGR
jgi:hypothetical protein